VFADYIQNRRFGPARIVQVGDSVRKSRPQMKQSHSRFVQHSPVAIGCAGAHTFEEAQDGCDTRFRIERHDYGHFSGPGVGKAYVDTCFDRSLDQ
jgi:hypothetical protein